MDHALQLQQIEQILENSTLLESTVHGEDCNNAVSHLLTDSRSLNAPESTLFAALHTELNDGHRFIEELYSRGVRSFIVEHKPDKISAMPLATFFVVKSVSKAIHALVGSQLKNYTGNSVVITGSYGKTTVKELIYRALLPACRAVRSPRSWNSNIGVPLSLWECSLSDYPECIITEIGIDGPGQAEILTPLIAPASRIGVMTPVTTEHDEAFSSHEDKIREKAKLFQACNDIVYDDSDPAVGQIIKSMYGTRRLHPVGSDTHPEAGSMLRALAQTVLEIISVADTAEHLAGLPEVSTRIDISAGSGNSLIIYDYFTADLTSLRDALDFMRRRDTSNHRPILLLGDMLHTGAANHNEISSIYAEAVNMAHRFGVDDTIAIGTEASEHLIGKVSKCYDNADEFMRHHTSAFFTDRSVLIKGNSNLGFDRIHHSLESAWHDTRFEVNLGAIAHNFNYYRSLVPPETDVICMVKASAYGMGAAEVAKTLQSRGAAYLAVAVVDEGVALREAGITMPIMVMNPVTNRFQALFEQRLEPVVFSLSELDRLLDEARKYGTEKFPVHIKLDTGMHRVGFLGGDFEKLAERINASGLLHVVSVFSHLATADCLDMDPYTNKQLRTFRDMTDKLRGNLGYDFKRHILNTAGMMRFSDSVSYEMVRLGIGLYGVSPFTTPEASKLKPVAALYSTVISLKKWPAGTPIGYGCRSVTRRDSTIATVPVGYADGINRHFGCGKVEFIVNGVKCPTIGNICMDQCMIDVTDVSDIAVNDRVEIFGPHQPIEHLAEALDTIPYEILTSISPRVKRIYHN